MAHDLIATRGTGFGLGLRTQHYADFLARKQPLDWLEIITDNYLIDGGKPLAVIDAIRRDYPVAMHGVAMSIGASQGVDVPYLQRVKALADRIEPLWVSDHLCWTGPGPEQLHDLYPLPYTDESARHVIAQIRRAQDVLGRRLVLENVSSYIRYRHDSASEWQFLAHIAQEADCLLLVDVNNIYVSSVNHGFDPLTYLHALPAHRVQQIHLAGHSDNGDHIIDTHDHPVAQPVWDLYAQACQRFGAVAAMIERDDHIPPLAELLDEMAIARRVAAEHVAPPEPVAITSITLAPTADLTGLAAVQRHFADRVLANALPPEMPEDLITGRLPIYHHAYRARLAEVLADTYAKTCLYMGSDTFEAHARDYAVAHPPRTRSLNRYGEGLVGTLRAAYPDNPELHELAQLDWDLRTRFDSADMPTLETAAAQASDTWTTRPGVLHPSALLRAIMTNVVGVWNAIHTDDDVPEAVALPAPATLLVWRKGHQPHFRTLDAAEAAWVQALHAGASVHDACAALLGSGLWQGDPTVLGGWLAQLLNDGLVRADGPVEGDVPTY
ncbi:MNIO family bufferin maturase [Acidovorax sp. LjRoot38]|uniref:MNIO family bufferin maturase n=1 Tax=Acidovorax sp. LjRoot38 TaxID=3342327 RepID=UPI003F508CCD